MHACMSACAYMCKCACMYLFARTCVFVCASVHTGCVRVCVRLQGCVNAGVRACGGGCMHICVKSVRVWFPILHHLRPGNLQWDWLACTTNTQTLVLLVLLLLNPLLSNHWLLLDHHGFPSTRDTARPQKQLLNIARMQGFGFLWSRRPVEGHFSTTHSDRIYTHLYGKIVYKRIIWRIYTLAKIHKRSYKYGYGENYLYIRIYTVRIYTAYIYIYGLGQP